jgi:oligopeptide transport system ATP-binding protein
MRRDAQQAGEVPVTECRDARVVFGRGASRVCALDGVSLAVNAGEVVGLVGESGSGKSTLARVLLGLEPLTGGAAWFAGCPVAEWLRTRPAEFRRRAQMVFQDPYGSLNPRQPVGAALAEVLQVHRIGSAAERPARVSGLLQLVGLDPAHATRYPHEFSGGQRQRIGIARALAVEPTLLVADEPVSALDVSVQVQILNLLKDLQRQRGLTLLFIAHDLAAVRYLCDRLYVLQGGRVVESGRSAEVYARPAHAYTRSLLAAVPDVERGLAARR